jgi:hypothetical protein
MKNIGAWSSLNSMFLYGNMVIFGHSFVICCFHRGEGVKLEKMPLNTSMVQSLCYVSVSYDESKGNPVFTITSSLALSNVSMASKAQGKVS